MKNNEQKSSEMKCESFKFQHPRPKKNHRNGKLILICYVKIHTQRNWETNSKNHMKLDKFSWKKCNMNIS